MTYRNTWVAYTWQTADPWVLSLKPNIMRAVNLVAGVVSRPDAVVFHLTVSDGAPPSTLATGGPLGPASGIIWLNTARTWWTEYQLDAVVAHEVGHCFGVPHVWDPGALMHPFGRLLSNPWDGRLDNPNDLAAFAAAGWTVYRGG